MRRLLSFALVALALFAVCTPALAEKRVALVIGNAAYRNTTPLANPKNDATDVAAALKALGALLCRHGFTVFRHALSLSPVMPR